jgi:hypothetical protein
LRAPLQLPTRLACPHGRQRHDFLSDPEQPSSTHVAAVFGRIRPHRRPIRVDRASTAHAATGSGLDGARPASAAPPPPASQAAVSGPDDARPAPGGSLPDVVVLSQVSAADGSPDFLSGALGSALSIPDVLPDAVLLRSQLLALSFPHGLLGMTPPMTVGAHMRDYPPPTTVYSQSSALTSSLRAPSDDAATILAEIGVAVAAARQRAQDAARALEQEQALVDAIERQYAETYHRLAGKGVSDGSRTSARHSADTFEPAPAPALTLRASLHAQAAALTSIWATVTDVLAPDSTQYSRWRDQVLQTLRCYALASIAWHRSLPT